MYEYKAQIVRVIDGDTQADRASHAVTDQGRVFDAQLVHKLVHQDHKVGHGEGFVLFPRLAEAPKIEGVDPVVPGRSQGNHGISPHVP